jgi:hypothetical protein
MIAVGGLYIGKHWRYLGVYNYQDDIYARTHPDLRGSQRVAHFSYRRGGKKGGVDVFLLGDSCPDPPSVMNIKKIFTLNGLGLKVKRTDSQTEDKVTVAQLKRADRDYSIHGEVLDNLPKAIADEIIKFERGDISYFCGEDLSKERRGPRWDFVPKIIPVTTLEKMTPVQVITSGKQANVPECCFEGNRDFGKGCITAWIPEANATFDGNVFTNWFWNPWGECGYPCYAERHHMCPPKSVYEWDESRFREELLGACRLDFGMERKLGRPVDILRYGKRTEIWTPWSKDNFMRELEIIEELRKAGKANTRAVITTRFMPYERELGRLVRSTQSSVFFGIGIPKWEIGAYAHGATNEFRIEQAIRFREKKVNSNLYMLIIADQEPSKRELQILEQTKYGSTIPIQLLPLRFRWKHRTLEITGKTYDYLKGKEKRTEEDLFDNSYGSYVVEERQLVVKRIHPFWLNLVARNQGRIRMCHHDNSCLYCGGCGLRQGFIKKVRMKVKREHTQKDDKEVAPIVQQPLCDLPMFAKID